MHAEGGSILPESMSSHVVHLRRPPKADTRVLLFTLAGGRCEFDNCNRYLLQHHVTHRNGVFAQMAHIVAFRPSGPRGESGLSSAERNDISNLMLLCPICHKLIDDNPELYPVETLRDFRRDHEAAIAEARVAVDIDPLSPYAHTMLGYVLTSAGQTEEAVEEARRGAESDPDSYWGQFVLATAYHFAARLSEAEGAYQRALSASKRHPLALANLGRLYAEWEKPGDAKAVDAELSARSRQEYVQPITLSLAAACAGRAEEALGLLQRACEERDPWLAWGALTSPWFEPLRTLPEYEEILTQMKLPVTGSDS